MNNHKYNEEKGSLKRIHKLELGALSFMVEML